LSSRREKKYINLSRFEVKLRFTSFSTLLRTRRLLSHPVGAASVRSAKHAPFRNG
jgi:hypothetical protein